jgi:hypothetical protein
VKKNGEGKEMKMKVELGIGNVEFVEVLGNLSLQDEVYKK